MLKRNFVAKNIQALLLLLKFSCGIIAILLTFQGSKSLLFSGYLIFLSLFFDFLIDFPSKNPPQINNKLNVLINMVSLAIAPSLMLYVLLKSGLQVQQISFSLPISTLLTLSSPLLLILLFAVKFSRDDINEQIKTSGSGIKVHISIVLIAALPFLDTFDPYNLVLFPQLGKNTYFLFGAAVLSSFLTTSNAILAHCIFLAAFISINFPMFSLKFKNFNFEENMLKYFFIIISATLFIFMQIIAVPFIFIVYLTFSIFNHSLNKKLKKMTIR